MNSRAKFLIFAALMVVLVLLPAPEARAQANVVGTWQTLPINTPINPVHAALMHNGKILIVSGSGNYPPQTNFTAGVFDPVAVSMTTQSITWDMFCNGMVVLPDGRPFIMGGNLQYDPFHGWQRTAAYDPATGKFVDMEDMAHGRWYPTSTELGDGRVMTFSGLDENGTTDSQVEIYKVGVGWGAPHAAPWTPPLYPRMHVLPNGKVFYSGLSTQSRTFDPSNSTWSGVIATTNYGGSRLYGSSVLLPLTPANAYKPKVMIFGGGNPSTATTEIIDLSVATPAWVFGPPMAQPRIEMNATLLPNGRVLTVGGSLNDEDTGTASLQADLYDSATNTMGSAGANAVPRLYHSVSLLLPDGRVWVAGGNPKRGTFEPSMEIYSPPYLFNPDGSLATRPAITSLGGSVIGYGGTSFVVTTPDAANVASVVLMKNGAVTHAFDMDQRMVGLNFVAGNGVLTVSGPPNGNTAPPGYYMIFLLNNAGVPSVAQFVQVSTAPSDTPPTGTITSPASDTMIAPGQAVSFAATGSAPSGSITGYSWSIHGASPATSTTQNPSITFPTPGIYTAALTVTDNAGITDPNPKTRTITVTTDPPPALTAAVPNTGIQGQTALNVTLTGSNFLAAPTCSFGLGIDVNSCTFNSPTKIVASLNILASAALGPRDIVITDTNGQSATLPAGFSVTGGIALPAPTLTAINPNSELQGASNVTVTLTGTNFQPSPTCNFDVDFGGTVNTCTFVSPTQINMNLTIAPNATLGGRNVVVTNPDGQSAELINGFTVTQNLGNTVQFGSGFTPGALVLNGNAQLAGLVLELTDGNIHEDSSAWYGTRVNVQNFVTDFTFQMTPGRAADGFAFVLQANSTAALGGAGGGLGYGVDVPGGAGGIPNSIAVKFDLFDNGGEGANTTGLYINGASPTIPAIDLTSSGIDLHSGDRFALHMTYDGTSLVMTLKDTTTNAVFTNTWPINIPVTIGATTAYAGFTGGTGGIAATQNILTWTLGPLAPTVGISPVGPLNFPDTTKNTTSAPNVVTVTNRGSAALHITTVSFSGPNPGDFSAASNTCTAAVAPSGTCTVGVTFTPSGTGARQANLQIADDASDSPQTLALTGTGTAQAGPDVTITPAGPVLFPNTLQKTTSAPAVLTVTNEGTAVLNITAVTVAGANAGDFAVATNTCTAAVAPNASCTLGIAFTPGAVGVRQATLQIADNASGSPQSVGLSGAGTSSNPNAPAVTVTPTSVTISATQGTTSTAKNFTVTNSVTTPLHITSVAFAGTNVSEFVNPNNPCVGITIAPNAICSFAVSFAPLTTGNHAETITITDDVTGSPQTVTVTGNSSSAAFRVTNSAASLAATATAGQAAQYGLQLMPGAGYSGSVTFACSGAPAGASCSVANPVALTNGTPATVAVTVTTTARSFLVPMANRQPVPRSAPHMLLATLGVIFAMLTALYQIRLRGGMTPRQLSYSGGFLALVLAVCGLTGCAGGSSSTPPPSTGTQAGTYTLTLTPTATSTSGKPIHIAPTQLTLTVN
jgi:PKD repeat protein